MNTTTATPRSRSVRSARIGRGGARLMAAGLIPAAIAVAATTVLTLGAAGIAGASTDTTEPADDAATPTPPAHTEAAHTAAEVPVPTAGEPSSPEAEAFCAAVVAAEAAFISGDPAAIGPAVEAATAAAPDDDARALLDAVIANAQAPDSPEFAEADEALTEWMKANCGYVEVHVTASDYEFEGRPAELPAGGTIFGLENVGEEVHEMAVMRINDDVTLSVEELLALPEEEAMTMVTPVTHAFAFPGETLYAAADLTPGRYVAVCFLPEGATPEVLMQLEELGVGGPEDTIPTDSGLEIGPPHFVLGMIHEFTVV